MNRLLVVRFMLIAISALIWIRCAIGPTSGTETGNPDITACCSTSLSLFDSADRWLPSTYLVEGETQLNPDKVYGAPPTVHLAKRVAASDSTDGAPAVGGTSVISSIDTIFVRDTLFVNDTIIIDTVVSDTFETEIAGQSGSSTLITRSIRHDSIFIVDTLFTQDTFVVLRVDSSRAVSSGGDATSSEMRFESIPATGSIVEYSVVRDPITGTVSLFVGPASNKTSSDEPNASVDIRSGSSCIMAARQLTIGETFISETFLDADGDGLLLSAATGKSLLSRGNFIYRRGGEETQLQIDFDAGADNLFATVIDNRIGSLFRRSVGTSGIIEQIRYGSYFFGLTGDTILLQRDLSYAVDSVETITDRFTCVPGSESQNHRQNACVGVVHTTNYRSGHMQSMEISIVPIQPVIRGQSPVSGNITAIIDFGKGLTGLLSGMIDYSQRTIMGTYAQAGTEYHCTFDGNGNSLTLQRFE